MSSNNLDQDLYFEMDFIENPENEANLEMKQHQICLNCQENGAEWKKFKRNYKLIELIFFSIGFILSLFCLGFSIWLFYFSDYNSIIVIIKYLDSINLISANYIVVMVSLFSFLIEVIAVLLDLVKLILILIVFNIFRKADSSLLIKKNRKHRPINQKDEQDLPIFYPAQSIKETIDRLKTRINVRNKFQSILGSLKRLEIFINIYFLVVIFLSKLIVAIFLLLNTFTSYVKLNDSGKFSSLNELNLSNNLLKDLNQTLNLDISDDFFQSCAHSANQTEIDLSKRNFTLGRLDFGCINKLNQDYIIAIIVYMFSSSIIKLIIQIILWINFKMNLMTNLINRSFNQELKLFNNYEKCRQLLIRINANQNREHNQKLWEDSLKNYDKNRDINLSYSKKIKHLLDKNLNNKQTKSQDQDDSFNDNEAKEAINLLEQVNRENEFNYDINNNHNSQSNVSSPYSTFKKRHQI